MRKSEMQVTQLVLWEWKAILLAGVVLERDVAQQHTLLDREEAALLRIAVGPDPPDL
jgi:hypothetical protein